MIRKYYTRTKFSAISLLIITIASEIKVSPVASVPPFAELFRISVDQEVETCAYQIQPSNQNGRTNKLLRIRATSITRTNSAVFEVCSKDSNENSDLSRTSVSNFLKA